MIHFFPTFSNDARNSPLANALAELAVPHRIFACENKLRYKWRIWLILVGWPKVFICALKSVIRSLLFSSPYPTTVVLGSHIEVLVFGAIRALLRRQDPEIVLLGFIYTQRNSSILNRLRETYFRLIFSIADKVLCHSTLEVERYKCIFHEVHAHFIYVPYGLHIFGREVIETPRKDSPKRPYILTAGRSGRDYATLFEAVAALPIELHVVCDSENALAGLTPPPNVILFRSCYDSAYIEELRGALFVVIPLAVNDISAGQMVLIQAMAFAKPTIITRTPTVEDYVSEGEQSLLVTPGDAEDMQRAIDRLLQDQALRVRLASRAVTTYEEKFSMKAHVRNIIKSIQDTSE